MVAVDPKTLRSELISLRQDDGRTMVKLMASETLRRALGDPEPSVLMAAFDSTVFNLGADLRTLALKNAFGIGLRDPGILKERRISFGSQEAVSRSPDTVADWEDEKIDELVARLVSGTQRPIQHWLVAVSISSGLIEVVAEGAAESGSPMRQRANPERIPFLPCFIYALPLHLSPARLTLLALFQGEKPEQVFGEASADLLHFCCGDGRQRLEIVDGGLPGLPATCHVAVHYDQPQQGVYFGIVWSPGAASGSPP